MTEPFELVAFNEEEHARFELRRYPDRWQMVYLRHRVGGGWFIKDEITVIAGPSTATCAVCGTPIGWIECPTGGWWAHDVHPADDHEELGRG